VADDRWFATQCFFLIEAGAIFADRGQAYEERITLWRAPNADQAMAKAVEEADAYADENGFERVDYVQSYECDEPREGAEVWSLMRDSWLVDKDYIDRFVREGDPHAIPFGGDVTAPDVDSPSS
jgi:hypothetical protein